MDRGLEITEPDHSRSESSSESERPRDDSFDHDHSMRQCHSHSKVILKKRGRKPKWWAMSLFYLSAAQGSSSAQVLTTCKQCYWQTKAQRPRSLALGMHLLQCVATATEVKQELLKDESLRRQHNKIQPKEFMPIFQPPVLERCSIRPPCAADNSSNERHSLVPKRSSVLQTKLQNGATFGVDEKDMSLCKDMDGKHQRAVQLLARAIAAGVLPLSILGKDTAGHHFYQLVKSLDPVFAEKLPMYRQMVEIELGNFFAAVKSRVKSAITAILSQSFCTIILDERDKPDGAAVVNVLLAITGQSGVRETFFLRSFFIKMNDMGVDVRGSLVQEAFKEYGDMKSVCAVIGNHASSRVLAELHALQKYDHMISCFDQIRVGQLLLQDLESIPWIRDVVSKVFQLFSNLFHHAKLYDRFRVLKDEFDQQACGNNTQGHALAPEQDQNDTYGRVKLPRTAEIPETLLPIRILSVSSILQLFLIYRELLRRLINVSEFYDRENSSTQRLFFIQTVTDKSLFVKALDVYHLFRYVQQYIRFFNDDSSLISEVYPVTKELKRKLRNLPTTVYYTKERRLEVMEVLDHRLKGRNGRVPLLNVLHRAAYCLDIRSIAHNLVKERNSLRTQMAHFVKSSCFPPELKQRWDGGEREAVRLLFEEYQSLRQRWIREAQQETQTLSRTYSRTPIMYWLEYTSNKSSTSLALREFALRVLSISPSSISIVRDRSLHNMLSISQRNKLDEGRLEMKIFCSWNEALSVHRSRTFEESRLVSHRGLESEACLLDEDRNDYASGSEAIKTYSNFLEEQDLSQMTSTNGVGKCSVQVGECLFCSSIGPH